MKAEDLRKIYVGACRRRRLKPTQAEGGEWFSKLRDFEAEQVKEALKKWDADPSTDLQGKKKSRWLPTAIELAKLTAEVASQGVKIQTEPQEFSLLVCKGEKHHQWIEYGDFSAAIPGSVKCAWCGSEADVIKKGKVA